MKERIGACAVTWRPDPALFERLLAATRFQVEGMLVLDNSEDAETAARLSALCERHDATLVVNPANVGLAAAYNEAARIAEAQGWDRLLLLDQDSVPGDGMVEKLARAARDLEGRGVRLAAVGPVIRDRRSSVDNPFVRFTWGGVRRRHCANCEADTPVVASFLISSGSLIALSALRGIGPFDESLFIDNVDMDWCFRAAARGWICYGVCGAVLEHSQGDAVYVLRIGGRTICVYRHSPQRLYFMARNRTALYRRATTPGAWIALDIPRFAVKFLIHALVLGPRLANLRAMSRGIAEAFKMSSDEAVTRG